MTHTPTAIPVERLRAIRAEARARRPEPFVDPAEVRAALSVLDVRGEAWAAAILGRSLARRSHARPDYPYLERGDLEILVTADVEEDRVRFDQIVDGASHA